MIPNYLRPQTEIAQQFEATANPLLDRIHAVVVGPAYLHADADAGNLVFSAYEEEADLPYSRLVDGEEEPRGSEVVDTAAVSLVAKNLRFELVSGISLAPYSDPYGPILEGSFLDLDDPSVAEGFDAGRPPTAGDIWRITTDTPGLPVIERRVLGLLGQDIAPTFGDSVYSGAVGTGSAATDEVAVAYASFTAPTVSFQSIGSAARRYGRRYGAFGLADNEGLRLLVEIVCATEGASPTFSATVNGVAVAIARASSPTLTTRFTLLTDLLLNVTRANVEWMVGDRLTLEVDLEHNPDIALFDSAVSFNETSFVSFSRRIASTLTIDVLSLSDAGVPTVRISDTSGLMSPHTTELPAATTTFDFLFDGASATFALVLDAGQLAGFHVGQRYSLPIVPASRSTRIFDKVLLNAPVGTVGDASSITATAYAEFSGTLPAVEPTLGATNYTAGASSVALEPLTNLVPGYPNSSLGVRTAADGYGHLAIAWRAVIPAGVNEGLVSIESSADILSNYQSYQMGSELGYGLAKALGGSQGKRVYALNTGGASLEDFVAAFDKLEAAANVYAIAILTENEDIMKLAAEHAQNMSLSTVKRFRRCYVGTDSPGEYPILDLQDDDTAYTATIQQGTGGLYTLVTFQQEDLDLSDYTITKGDKLVVTGTGQSYEIALQTGPKTLTLVAGPSAPVGATPCKIIAADTPENTARFVWERSARLGANVEQDRRISNIWVDKGRLGGQRVPNRFGACEIAGIRTALQPQQGLTRTEISFVDSAPSMYTRFKPTLLDSMAARGVWIITQNAPDAPCYVRHQLTTAVSNGSLYYEDSVGVNVDSVCFAMDDITDPKIGKRNATPRTVSEIKSELHGMLSDLTQDDYDSVIGPQLAGFYNSNGDADALDVSINPIFKDRIDVAVVLEIPLPLNNIRIVVYSRTIRDTGAIVSQLTATTLA